MKTILSVAALTVMLSAGVSFAQQAPNTATPTPPAQQPAQTETAPSANSPQPPEMGQHRPDDDAMMRGGWRRGPMNHRPFLSRAARFRIENGDVKIDIKCADDEPMKACADELNQILDRLEGRSSSSRYEDDQ
ncbi:hypothetical protein [Rhizobium jaguaris]|uniref:Uncharacterized protein n=1 Tax=Rhizobium jaguaris TaxID=1312183 RepID=A0A387FMJ8_9HYPH|nr:hypothetical protein [Rhizobium jaguaris]AYG59669.1 hypothetical protein CCGE525_13310 [Rhizobium jaguaris]